MTAGKATLPRLPNTCGLPQHSDTANVLCCYPSREGKLIWEQCNVHLMKSFSLLSLVEPWVRDTSNRCSVLPNAIVGVLTSHGNDSSEFQNYSEWYVVVSVGKSCLTPPLVGIRQDLTASELHAIMVCTNTPLEIIILCENTFHFYGNWYAKLLLPP